MDRQRGFDARNVSQLHEKQIAAVVDISAEESVPRLTRDPIYLCRPIVDGIGNSEQMLSFLIHTVSNLIQNNIPTLMACSAGMSRSPVVAVTAYAYANLISIQEAVREHSCPTILPIYLGAC